MKLSCENKNYLVVGVANERSLAWGVVQSLKREKANIALTFVNEAIEKRVRPLAQEINADLVLPCDVRNEAQIKEMMLEIEKKWGKLDGIVHSVAFADKDDLEGSFLQTSKNGFLNALEISAYSLIPLVREALPLLEKANDGASIITFSYYGADKVIPNYNVMGVAKAALECTVRYMAAELGPKNIRVNAVSAGPVRTLAAAGIRGFKGMLQVVENKAPLRRNVSLEEVAEAGLFFLSPRSGGVTGETLFVDSGYQILGM